MKVNEEYIRTIDTTRGLLYKVSEENSLHYSNIVDLLAAMSLLVSF